MLANELMNLDEVLEQISMASHRIDVRRGSTMNPFHEYVRNETRRQFFSRGANAVGWAALASLLGDELAARRGIDATRSAGAAAACPALTHFPPKAKHVIYLHMVGGPSQMDLYDYKPKMDEWYDKDLPDSVRMGQRLTTMTSRPEAVPDRAVEVQVRSSTARAACGSRELLPYTSPDGRRHVLHPEHAHRGDQPRAGHHLHADRQPGHGPALPGRRGCRTAWAR